MLFVPTPPKLLGGEHNHIMELVKKRPPLGLGSLQNNASRSEEVPP